MASFFSMQFSKLASSICLIIAVACFGLLSASIPRPTQFNTVRELKDFAVPRGFVFHSGTRDGVVRDSFYLADHPLTMEDDLQAVCTRRDCGLTPAWRGIFWVAQIRGRSKILAVDTIRGKWRVWGNVLVAGDEDLMDQIEELYKKTDGGGTARLKLAWSNIVPSHFLKALH